VRHRRAVGPHERSATLRQIVDRLREDLFPHAGLAENQNTDRARGEIAHEAPDGVRGGIDDT